MENNIPEVLVEMANLSLLIETRARIKAISECLTNLLSYTGWDIEQGMNALSIHDEDRKAILNLEFPNSLHTLEQIELIPLSKEE